MPTPTNRFMGLCILDEPQTAPSPTKQLELLRLLRGMATRGHAQFAITTHSQILLACPEATICSCDRTRLSRVEYEATEDYQIYRDFMNDRCAFLEDRPSRSRATATPSGN